MSQHDSKLVDDGDQEFETLDQGGFEPLEDFGGAPETLAETGDDVAASDDVETEAEEEEEDDSPKAKRRVVVLEKPRANVYTIMLIVSLVALTIGCLSLYGEMKQYDMDFRARSAR